MTKKIPIFNSIASDLSLMSLFQIGEVGASSILLFKTKLFTKL